MGKTLGSHIEAWVQPAATKTGRDTPDKRAYWEIIALVAVMRMPTLSVLVGVGLAVGTVSAGLAGLLSWAGVGASVAAAGLVTTLLYNQYCCHSAVMLGLGLGSCEDGKSR